MRRSRRLGGFLKGVSPFIKKHAIADFNRGFLKNKYSPFKKNGIINPKGLVKVERKGNRSLPYILKGLNNDTSKRVANSNYSFFTNPLRDSICQRREIRRKVIMSKTKGKGLKVKFAKWTDESRIRC